MIEEAQTGGQCSKSDTPQCIHDWASTPQQCQVGLFSELNLGATKSAISRIGNPNYREFLTPQYCNTTATPGQLRVHIQSWV